MSTDSPKQERLVDALRRAAADLARAEPPPLVGPSARPIAAAADAAAAASVATGRPWRLAPAFGACLALLVASMVLLLAGGEPASGPRIAAAAPPTFVTVIGAERWEQLVAEGDARAWLVSTELPRERLAALGLPFDPGRAADRVHAEVLMHASGDVIAVRVLH